MGLLYVDNATENGTKKMVDNCNYKIINYICIHQIRGVVTTPAASLLNIKNTTMREMVKLKDICL
jgi:hypothetical protein